MHGIFGSRVLQLRKNISEVKMKKMPIFRARDVIIVKYLSVYTLFCRSFKSNVEKPLLINIFQLNEISAFRYLNIVCRCYFQGHEEESKNDGITQLICQRIVVLDSASEFWEQADSLNTFRCLTMRAAIFSLQGLMEFISYYLGSPPKLVTNI